MVARRQSATMTGMRYFAIVLTLLLGQTGQPSDIRQELEQFEQRLATTWKQGDCDGWGGMLADDWSVIHLTGEIMTKSSALKLCRESRPVFETFAIDEITVRAYGDSAVVTGLYDSEARRRCRHANRSSALQRFLRSRQRPMARRRVTRHPNRPLTRHTGPCLQFATSLQF